MAKKRFLLPIYLGMLSLFVSHHYASAAPALFMRHRDNLSSRLRALDNKVCATFGLTQNQWNSYKNSLTSRLHYKMCWSTFEVEHFGSTVKRKAAGFFKRFNPFSAAIITGDFSSKFKNKIAGIFKRLKGAPRVTIQDCVGDSTAFSAVSKVYLNEDKLKNISEYELSGIILHEIAHLTVASNFLRNCIKRLAKKYADTVSSAAVQTLLKDFDYLHEEIADTLAALAGGIKTTQALAARFARIGGSACETHPSDATRVAYLRPIASQMASDSHYKNGNSYGAALQLRLP